MTANARFTEFLQDIEPSDTTVSHAQSAHTKMRDFLEGHSVLGQRHVKTFLSGSYKRDTAIRPITKDDEVTRPDVDIIIQTNHSKNDSPKVVLDELYDAIAEEYSEIRKQSRSVGIKTSLVDMDVVPIIDPEDGSGLYIPDRALEKWLPTNPPGHTTWTTQRNEEAGYRFKPLVKLAKWWRRHNSEAGLITGRHPKGFVLECIIAECMDNNETHFGELFAKTFDQIAFKYAGYITLGTVPMIGDPGVPGNSVTSNVTFEEFKSFYDLAKAHAAKANDSLKSSDEPKWREIFGSRFPTSGETKAASQGLLKTAVVPSVAVPLLEFPDRPVQPVKPAGFA